MPQRQSVRPSPQRGLHCQTMFWGRSVSLDPPWSLRKYTALALQGTRQMSLCQEAPKKIQSPGRPSPACRLVSALFSLSSAGIADIISSDGQRKKESATWQPPSSSGREPKQWRHRYGETERIRQIDPDRRSAGPAAFGDPGIRGVLAVQPDPRRHRPVDQDRHGQVIVPGHRGGHRDHRTAGMALFPGRCAGPYPPGDLC
jgi:hypothetical protein